MCSDLCILLNKGFYVKPCNDKPYHLNYTCETRVLSASVIGWGQSKQLDNSLSQFYQWFVGFCDAEASFLLQPVLSSENTIRKVTWIFSIELHKDDLGVLEYIRNNLGIGNIRLYKDKCIYVVTNIEGTHQLISIFDKYNLNSTKYLDYCKYKEAFLLYQERDKKLTDLQYKIELANKIVELKNTMNTKRVNTTMPLDHNIVITKSWLLGYLEGDSSFFISRTDIEPVFTLAATEEQCLLFEKIKEFLMENLGFDKYSLFKLKCTQIISINKVKAREIGKPSIILTIKNIRLLNNYFIPYFEDIVFISKKGLDFQDFKLIVQAVYKGSHKTDEIRSLILKLSYTMNNFRLSTCERLTEALSVKERDIITNAAPLLEYLSDGRIRDLSNNSILTTTTSCVYEMVTPEGTCKILDSLKDVLSEVGVGFRTLKKQLDLDERAEVKGYTIKRISVFSKK